MHMNHDPTEEYNPERDYHRFMGWIKYGVVACIVIIIVMRFAIG